MRKVYITTANTGQNFGTYAIIRDLKTNRKIAETDIIRPYGFTANAYSDGESLASKMGWKVVEP